MKKRQALAVVSLIIIFVAIIGNAYVLGNDTSKGVVTFMMKMAIIFAIMALVTAVYYLVTGYKKDSAKFLRFYIHSFILSELTTFFSICITLIGQSAPTSRYALIVPSIIVFLILNFLLFKPDLGKRTSLNLSYLCLLLHIGVIILSSVFSFGKTTMITYILRSLAQVSLSFVLIIVQQLKYYDKKQRNTK